MIKTVFHEDLHKKENKEVNKMHRVYDDRTNETLYQNEDIFECVAWVKSNIDENDDDFSHVWIEELK